jgi:hypothetical protein
MKKECFIVRIKKKKNALMAMNELEIDTAEKKEEEYIQNKKLN